MRILALLFVLLLAGCQTTNLRDEFGNTYPEVCRGPLTCEKGVCKMADKQAHLQELPPSEMPKPTNPNDTRLYGRSYASGLIIIDKSLSGYSRDDTLRHEMCHIVAGAWHR